MSPAFRRLRRCVRGRSARSALSGARQHQRAGAQWCAEDLEDEGAVGGVQGPYGGPGQSRFGRLLAASRAQTTAECDRPGDRTTGPPRRCRLPGIRGRQPGILPPPGRQRPRQHTLLDAAQACQEISSSGVQQHLGVCPRAPAVVPGLVAAPLPAGPQRLRFQSVTARDAADQRRGRLPVQGSGPQEAGMMGHSTTVSCSPARRAFFVVLPFGPQPVSTPHRRARKSLGHVHPSRGQTAVRSRPGVRAETPGPLIPTHTPSSSGTPRSSRLSEAAARTVGRITGRW